jgi:glycosyltransferase involved in cell wall biosynthesis
MMKIVHIVNEGLFGGVLRVALAQSHVMNMLGFDSQILLLFSLRIPRDVLTKYYKARVLIIKENVIPQFLHDITNPILREVFGRYLRKVMLASTPDIIILHNLTGLYLAEYLKKLSNAKLVLYIHNPTSPPSLTNLVKAIKTRYRYPLDFINSIDMVITSSFKMRNFVRYMFGLDAYVIPPGCDPVIKPPENKDKIVLVPQRISTGKRIHEISKLLTRCKSAFVTVFAGSSHYSSQRAISLIKKSGLKHLFIIINPSDKGLEQLYKRALCSITIVREPFGMPIIESASYGTPPIAPRDAGASELFEHGVHGFFFEYESSIPDYVDELVFNPELAIKMGYVSWKICKERYTWQSHVMNLVNVIKKL